MNRPMDRPESAPPPTEPLRLAKVVAAQVPCSRREAEQYITEGWVQVDGVCVTTPQTRVGPGQRIEVDPKARLQPVTPATFLVHKPAGMNPLELASLLTEASRWSGDRSGIRPSRGHLNRLQTLAALPAAASGLVVLSQDGRVIRRLTEDAAWLEHEFIAEVRCPQSEDRPPPPDGASWQSENRLRFALKNTSPAVIEPWCEQAGLPLVALRRIRIGRMAMAGLPPGQWRYLAATERF